ncbi:DNA polymerase III subunit delta [Pleurocapsales cyanobacterium LEGE 10410]|nr:DNA polymerase III subunit delta [Pleurocapsales cyanobacterium LEGE 10410]
MPVYLYWGEDDFAIAQAVEKLQARLIDPNWLQFNYHKLIGDRAEAIIEGLNQAMTPVFGMGERLVWLANTNLCQQKPSADLLEELKRTLNSIPETSHLLLTTDKKPDGRLASTKLLREYAQVKDFSLIPPWKTDLIAAQVKETAQTIDLKLAPGAIALLAESVGNNTRQLWNELEKLKIYRGEEERIVNQNDVSALVLCNTQNSLQLAAAIKEGRADRALGLVTDLIDRNEPALKIVATLIGQFRTWTIVKLMQQAGARDNRAIASAAGISNPNRLYFIRQEIQQATTEQFLATLPLLLELEYSLKSGAEALSTLQAKTIELCLIFS